MNIPKTKVRFDIKNQLGEGSFSIISLIKVKVFKHMTEN